MTPYTDINNLINIILQRSKVIFGENLVGVYLSGSLSYGDFRTDSSDIDLVVVIKHIAGAQEIGLLRQLFLEIAKRDKKWSDRLECAFVPIEIMDSLLPPKLPRPYFGGGVFYAKAPYGNEWIINQYLLYHHAIALYGPAYKKLIAPIDIAEVQKACKRDLLEEWEPKIRDPIWLANSHYQAYIVLNLCRILYTVLRGATASKKISAQWVRETYGFEWKYLIDAAENWHYGIEMREKESITGFINFAIAKVNAN